MNISELYTLYKQYPVITTDSRTCPPGSIFFALKGESFDGNAYAEKALQAGCAYAIIDNPSVQTGEKTILVNNVLETLQQLAALHRKTLGTPVIGITGTNGKTTTKELLSAVLSQQYNTLSTPGNLNNHIGVPLTLLRLTEEHDMAVIEMGASHPGEIRELANIAQPDYGIVTNVGRAHLEGFGSLEGVIKTKGELYEYIRETNGSIFINQDNTHLTKIAGGIKQITYGEIVSPDRQSDKSLPDIGGRVLSRIPYLSLQWQRRNGVVHTIDTHLIGDYNLWNILAAIVTGLYFKIPAEQIDKAIAGYEPNNNRSQLKKTTYNQLIIDAYNANPDSMKAALDNFASLNVFPKAVILGDMRELGEDGPELHAEIIRQIKSCHFEKILLCGELFAKAEHEYTSFPTVEYLIEHLKTNPLKDFYILIKGSRGLHLEKAIQFL